MKSKYIIKTLAIIAAISNTQAVRLLANARNPKINPDIQMSEEIKPNPIIAGPMGMKAKSNLEETGLNPDETGLNSNPNSDEFNLLLTQPKPKNNRKLLYSVAAVSGVGALIALVGALATKFIHTQRTTKPQITPNPVTTNTANKPVTEAQGSEGSTTETPVAPRTQAEAPAERTKSEQTKEDPTTISIPMSPKAPTRVQQTAEELSDLEKKCYDIIRDKDIAKQATRIFNEEEIERTRDKLVCTTNGNCFCYFIAMSQLLNGCLSAMKCILTQNDTLNDAVNTLTNDNKTKTNAIIARAFLVALTEYKLGLISKIDENRYQNIWINEKGTHDGWGDPGEVVNVTHVLHPPFLSFGGISPYACLTNNFNYINFQEANPSFFCHEQSWEGQMWPHPHSIETPGPTYRLSGICVGCQGNHYAYFHRNENGDWMKVNSLPASIAPSTEQAIIDARIYGRTKRVAIYEKIPDPPPTTESIFFTDPERQYRKYSKDEKLNSVAWGKFCPPSDDQIERVKAERNERIKVLDTIPNLGCLIPLFKWGFSWLLGKPNGLSSKIPSNSDLERLLLKPSNNEKDKQRLVALAAFMRNTQDALMNNRPLQSVDGEHLLSELKDDIEYNLKQFILLSGNDTSEDPYMFYNLTTIDELCQAIKDNAIKHNTANPSPNVPPVDRRSFLFFWATSTFGPLKIELKDAHDKLETRYSLEGVIVLQEDGTYNYIPREEIGNSNYSTAPSKYKGSKFYNIYEKKNLEAWEQATVEDILKILDKYPKFRDILIDNYPPYADAIRKYKPNQ
ncbi:MAG: hypothetical protein NkDv07_0072 [Candidatus Improbicoccus devescovinae]|nr:MAG: hypothetical protein NkDv07_0072 [Candidatus Improbicoccus devescovinae]